MTTMAEAGTVSVEIDRVFDATVERIWKMFTDPDELAVWGAGDWYEHIILDLDLRPGGVIHHRVKQLSDDSLWTFHGVYEEVEENTRLAYTFDWKTDWREAHTPSLVAIDFSPTDDGKAAVHVTHSDVPPGPAADSTKEHWKAFLDKLEEML